MSLYRNEPTIVGFVLISMLGLGCAPSTTDGQNSADVLGVFEGSGETCHLTAQCSGELVCRRPMASAASKVCLPAQLEQGYCEDPGDCSVGTYCFTATGKQGSCEDPVNISVSIQTQTLGPLVGAFVSVPNGVTGGDATGTTDNSGVAQMSDIVRAGPSGATVLTGSHDETFPIVIDRSLVVVTVPDAYIIDGR
jgi:hypothetical protein